MTLDDLGYTNNLEKYRVEQGLDQFEIGRVSSEHKERYAAKNQYLAQNTELFGNLRLANESKIEYQALGD